jgi:MFS family permease
LYKFSFAVNASFLTGIIPSILSDKIGARKTMLLGGLLITASHIFGAMMFAGGSNSVSVFTLFLIGIVGGQGASMIFLSAWSAMLKYHSILCTNLITAVLFAYFLGADTFHLALKQGIFPEKSLPAYLWILAICGLGVYVVAAFIFTSKNKASEEEKSQAKGLVLKKGITMYAAV